MSSCACEASPTFLRLLLDDSVKSVIVSGCGGGFDFMHSTVFLPMLAAAGKRVIIHSYSFGEPQNIRGSVPFKMTDVPESVRAKVGNLEPEGATGWPEVRIVNSNCAGPRHYAPECCLMQFMEMNVSRFEALRNYQDLPATVKLPNTQLPQALADERDAQPAPAIPLDASGDPVREPSFYILASYARSWTASALRHFYTSLCIMHQADAFLVVDGGSDSLMKGTEAHVSHPHAPPGDQIEDATTVAAVASLPDDLCPVRVLVSLGFGCDRFMGCSDEDSFAGVAELTAAERPALNDVEKKIVAHTENKQLSGFLGVLAMEKTSTAARTYRELIEYCQNRTGFRSVIANSICATSEGLCGDGATASKDLAQRVRPGELQLWPLMSWAIGLDVRLMFKRSHLCWRLLRCKSVDEMYKAQMVQRADSKKK